MDITDKSALVAAGYLLLTAAAVFCWISLQTEYLFLLAISSVSSCFKRLHAALSGSGVRRWKNWWVKYGRVAGNKDPSNPNFDLVLSNYDSFYFKLLVIHKFLGGLGLNLTTLRFVCYEICSRRIRTLQFGGIFRFNEHVIYILFSYM